jgi:hypothetical protein
VLESSQDASTPTGLDAAVDGDGSRAQVDAVDGSQGASNAADASIDGSTVSSPDAAMIGDAGDASTPPVTLETLPYARAVHSFTAGDHAGFGQASLPDIVLGPPMGKGTSAGSLDVLSLGVGGSIVLTFGEREIVDRDGPDFIVFENAFWAAGKPQNVFAEVGEVSVSEDGTTWHAFSCDADGDGLGHYEGCAGWTPTLVYEPLDVYPLDPELTGGDTFDLDDVGLSRARYVRIRDLASTGASNTGGFDLDAIGLVHYEDKP